MEGIPSVSRNIGIRDPWTSPLVPRPCRSPLPFAGHARSHRGRRAGTLACPSPRSRMPPIPSWLRIALLLALVASNVVLHVVPLLLVALVKALLPWGPARRICNRLLSGIAESWIGANNLMLDRFTDTRVEVTGTVPLAREGRYLVLANHQSWVDILVLQHVFNRRIPLLRFFLKSQLFWVPLLGLAWWALDFPFMKRYSRRVLARRPELAGRDVAATRRACERFRAMPVAMMNFVEGTRFSEAKRDATASPYRFLLRPKSGGVAFVLDAMGDALQSVLDVTIVYPGRRPGMLDLLGNRIGEVRVDVRERPIPAELLAGDYASQPAFRARFQQWLNGIWIDKDAAMARLGADESRTAP